MAFAFFKKKKDEVEPGGESQPTASEPSDAGETAGVLTPDPAKAARFYEHAQAMHDSSNFAYAMTLWLKGIRLDPANINALESFMKSAAGFTSHPDPERPRDPPPKAPKREQLEEFAGRGAWDKYLTALLHWGVRPMDWAAGLRVFESAVKLGYREAADWIGRRVLGVAGEDPKAKKDSFVRMMNLFLEIDAYNQAVVAGEIACRLDPTDARLAGEVKNIAAQATMKKGGFEEGQKVEAGAFRKAVKDIQAQREIEEEERIVKTEEVQARAIERAKADYESRPTDMGAIQKYARLLLERGMFEDEKTAFQVLIRAYRDTQNYRFKAQAGEIDLRVARRQVREFKEAAAADPGNLEKQQIAARAERRLAEMEVKEYEERVANNPTDLQLRFDLGERLLAIGEDEKAIEQFQQARASPGVAVHALKGLGMAFARLGWLDEAEQSWRDAIASHPVQTDDLAIELRYGLMEVMQRKAEESRDLAHAEEAFKLASGIAVQRIGYRDIRQRRQQLQDLVKSLRSAPS